MRGSGTRRRCAPTHSCPANPAARPCLPSRSSIRNRTARASVRRYPASVQGDGCEAGESEQETEPYIPLPRGLANPRAQAGAVFGQFAGLYDEGRPGYPPEVFDELTRRCGLVREARVLEIGCGTGQATRDLAASGAAIRCVEPGAELAELARRNLADAPNVTIETTTFEAAHGQPGSYDIVVSATAFHWIDPHVSFVKAARLLRPGGSLALLTNAHGAGGTHTDQRIAQPIRELHRRLAPQVGDWAFPSAEVLRERAQAGGDIAAVWARVERKLADPRPVGHLFDPPAVFLYPWLARYDRDHYLTMLASQSSYALLDPERRARLLDGIGRLVDEHLNGLVTKQYVTVLAIARRLPAAQD
jgi:SAM-dependent methyltransferase